MQVQNSEFIFPDFRPSFLLLEHLRTGRPGRNTAGFALATVRKVIVHGAEEPVTSDPESKAYREQEPAKEASSGWLKFALLTAATALAGGVATAWFYRKTLTKLRETGENPQNSHFGISPGQRPDDDAGDGDEI